MTPTRKITTSRGQAIRAAAGAGVIGLALALTACGGGSSTSSQSHTSASAPASTTQTGATSTATTTSTSSSSPAGGTTAPGTSLAIGAPAVVDYKPGVNNNSPVYRLQVTTVGIQKGSPAELNGVELEKAEQGKTPYYVKLKIRNEGTGNASAEDGVPAVGFQAIDDRGQQGQELTVLGKFRTCESGTQPKQFTRGVTFETCEIYLVGSGGSIVKEEWIGSVDKYSENPIDWKAS